MTRERKAREAKSRCASSCMARRASVNRRSQRGRLKPIFSGAEDGTADLTSTAYHPGNMGEAIDALRMLGSEKHDYETVVIDPVNWLEPLVVADVVGSSGKSLQDWGGGYGRGAAAAMERWRVFVSELERIWRGGRNIVLLAHAQVRNDSTTPAGGVRPLRNRDAPERRGLLKQWVDFVLFAKFEAYANEKKRASAPALASCTPRGTRPTTPRAAGTSRSVAVVMVGIYRCHRQRRKECFGGNRNRTGDAWRQGDGEGCP